MQEIEKEDFLLSYASRYHIEELSSEELLRLLSVPYLMDEIAQAFGITVDELKRIKKQKGLANIILENTIRNIETILHFIDSKSVFVSNKIRQKVVDILILSLLTSVPRIDFYRKKILEYDFSRKQVKIDMIEKQIDFEYRIHDLSNIIAMIEKEVAFLLEQEKDYLLHNNHKKLYYQLLKKKQDGMLLSIEDLTYDILFELLIVENIPDTLVGELYGIDKYKLRYLRQKQGITNKWNLKVETFPELLMYWAEEQGKRPSNLSNYDFEEYFQMITEQFFKTKTVRNEDLAKEPISICVDGKCLEYYVTFSDEKYQVNSKKREQSSRGGHRNQKKESETRRLHGKIGEKIALEAEKRRLIKLGLEDLIEDVLLVAQIDDDITLDGLGYDLLSFNEHRQRICVEVKTSYGKKDKPFFISQKEIDVLQGLKMEYNCLYSLLYYVLVDGNSVVIKQIFYDDFSQLNLTPVLYKVG